MACMCDTCFTIDKRKYRYGLFCKDKNCDGFIIQIDELILPVISLLNKKGYYTEYCCSGHVWEKGICNVYISFNRNVRLPFLPKGFLYDKDIHSHIDWGDRGMRCIRKNVDVKLDDEDKQKELLIAELDLLEWAGNLPNINEGGIID